MKPCSICKETKELLAFGRDRHKRDGLTVICKPCSKLVRNGYRAPPKPILTDRKCKACNIVKPISDYYKHTAKCKSCTLASASLLRVPVERVLSDRPQSVYKRLKQQSDPLFKLRSNIGTLIANSLSKNGYTKSDTTVNILGCSVEEFKNYLESQFTLGMSWDNRNEWHIDHIVPISYACSEEEILLLNHYSNLRPLWSTANQAKASKLTTESLNHPLYKTITENRILG